MNSPENLVVVHLSATAVYVVIGNIVSNDDIRIKGLSQVKISDFYQGKILSQERLKSVIKQALHEAENMANCRVHSVWLSFSSPEMMSKNSFGKIDLSGKPITVKDIVEALGQAKKRELPSDYYLMQYTQQGVYVNDESVLIDDPIESYANSMTVMYHLMMMPVVSLQNIEALFRPANVRVDHMIFDAVAGAEYSLMRDEREHGVCYIDIGYSTTSVCVYKENKLIYTACYPHGSHEATMDISADLGLSMLEAENLKKRHGTIDVKSVDIAQFKAIRRQGSADELTVNLHELALIIEARYIEILKVVFAPLFDAKLVDYLERGVVLSGGGSRMNGIIPFAKRLLNLPVFLTNTHPAISASNEFDNHAAFKQVSALIEEPNFQTAFGALLYSQSQQFQHSERSSTEALDYTEKAAGLFEKLNHFLRKII